MPFSPAEIEMAILLRIPAQTGYSLEDLARFAQEKGPKDIDSLRNWFQEEYGLNLTQSSILVKSLHQKDSPVFSKTN